MEIFTNILETVKDMSNVTKTIVLVALICAIVALGYFETTKKDTPNLNLNVGGAVTGSTTNGNSNQNNNSSANISI